MPVPTARQPGEPVTAVAGKRRIPLGTGSFVEEIRDGLFWVSDGAYNTMFLVSAYGVVAIDPLPTLGSHYLGAIETVTRQPITHVVYTHEHTDHIGAASIFPKTATIIAHRDTAAILARRRDPRRPRPTVTFADRSVLRTGEQTLVLEYRGVNHSPGNIFLYAPRQKVLMLVDIVYPGYVPYPGLGVAVDVPGYIQAHREALTFDFTEFVGGHVDRLGTRADVEQSLEFVLDLKRTAEESLAEQSFPRYVRDHHVEPTATWFAHDDYEHDRVTACYTRLLPRWRTRLKGVERALATHCRAMMIALATQFGGVDPASSDSPRG